MCNQNVNMLACMWYGVCYLIMLILLYKLYDYDYDYDYDYYNLIVWVQGHLNKDDTNFPTRKTAHEWMNEAPCVVAGLHTVHNSFTINLKYWPSSIKVRRTALKTTFYRLSEYKSRTSNASRARTCWYNAAVKEDRLMQSRCWRRVILPIEALHSDNEW